MSRTMEAAVGFSRRDVLIAGAACAAMMLPRDAAALEGDMLLGDPGARVQLVEYASLTCPHCAAFHAEVFPRIKAAYIDTRRIGFTLREFPTAPAPVAFAMFQLARCGGADAQLYFERVGELFRQQRAIIETGTGAGVRDALIRTGASWGLSEAQVIACMQDETAVARITGSIEAGQAIPIRGTPALVLNGQLLTGEAGITLDGLSAALDAALAV